MRRLPFRPDVIVFGGGVMAQQHMLDRVRTKFTALLNGYLPCTRCERLYCDTCSCWQWFKRLWGTLFLQKQVSEKLKNK